MPTIFSNKTYDVLKWIASTVFPAFIAMYSAIAIAWGWSYTEQIVATLAAINAFLGVILGVSTIQYNKFIKNNNENANS